MRLPVFPHFEHVRRVNRRYSRVRTLSRLIYVVPLLAFSVGSGLYLVQVGHLIYANLGQIVAVEAATQLHRQVALDKVTTPHFGEVDLFGLKVANGATFAAKNGECILTATHVSLHYSLTSLIADPANSLASIISIRLTHPFLLVERKNDRTFNFTDIVNRPSKPNAKPFRGQMTFNSGTLLFRDYLAKIGTPDRPAQNELHNVNAYVDARNSDATQFQIQGTGLSGRLIQAEANGDAIRSGGGSFRMQMNASGANLPYWARYLAGVGPADVTSGTGNIRLFLSHSGKFTKYNKNLDFLLGAQIADAAIQVKKPGMARLVVSHVDGKISASPVSVSYLGTASAAGSPLNVNATLFDFSRPQLGAVLSGKSINIGSIARAFPAVKIPLGLTVAPVDAVVKAAGPLLSPTISIEANTPRVAYFQNEIRNASLSMVLARNVLSISRLTFTTQDGHSGTLRAQLDPRHVAQTLSASGQVVGLNLATLPLGRSAQHLNVSGTANVNFVTRELNGSRHATADVKLRHLHVLHTSLDEVTARIGLLNGKALSIQRLDIRDPKGMASIDGTVPITKNAGSINLRVNASGIEIGRLIRPYSKLQLDGLGYYRGSIGGVISAPTTRGDLEIYGASYSNLLLDSVAGHLEVTPSRLALSHFEVQKFPASVQIDGTINNLKSRQPALDLGLKLSQADVQDLISLSNEIAQYAPHKAGRKVPTKTQRELDSALPTVSGATTGNLHITGTPKNPQIIGSAVMKNGTAGPFRIDRVQASFGYKAHKLSVTNGLLRGEGATITARGDWSSQSGAIDGIFTGTNFSLDRLNRLYPPYFDLQGMVEFSGAIGGTLNSPTATVGVVGNSLIANGQKLAQVSAFASYANGELDLTGDPWQFTILSPPGVSGGSQPIEYDISSFKLHLPTTQFPHLRPSIEAAGSISGQSPERLDHLIRTFESSRFATQPAGLAFDNFLDNLPSPVQGNISLPQFTIDGFVDQPSIHADINIADLQVGTTTAQNITLHIGSDAGAVRSTHVVGSASGVIADQIPLDSVNLDASMSGSVIHLTTLHATNLNAYLDALGTADLNGDITATLDASNIPLSLFQPLLPKTRKLGGTVTTLYVEASGKTSSPDFMASFGVASPSLTVERPPDKPGSNTTKIASVPISSEHYVLDSIRSEKITVVHRGSGHVRLLTISDLTAFKNHKPVVQLNGVLPFGSYQDLTSMALAGSPDLRAKLEIADLGALAAFVPSVDPTRTTGSLSAAIGPGLDGTTAGSIDLSNASLGFTGVGTELKNIRADIGLTPVGINIRRLSAQSGAGGTVGVTGSVDLVPTPDIHLVTTFKQFEIDEVGGQYILGHEFGSGFKGTVNGSLYLSNSLLTPKIVTKAGAPIFVSDATGVIPSGTPQPGPAAGPPPIDPNFDIHVQLGTPKKTVHVQNAFLRADADGYLTLAGSLTSPVLHSRLTVYGGKFIIPPSTVLKFVKPYGTVALDYPVPALDPATGLSSPLGKQVDLYAQATVRVRPSVLASSSSAVSAGSFSGSQIANSIGSGLDNPVQYVIDVHIHGSLDSPDKLQLDLESNPGGLSRNAMLAALGDAGAFSGFLGGNLENAFKEQVAEAFNSILLPSFIQPFETGVESAFGLSAFNIDLSPNAPIHVTFTKDLTPRLEVTYSRFFGARPPGSISAALEPTYTVSLGYTLAKRLQVNVSTDEQNNNTVALQGVFGF